MYIGQAEVDALEAVEAVDAVDAVEAVEESWLLLKALAYLYRQSPDCKLAIGNYHGALFTQNQHDSTPVNKGLCIQVHECSAY